MRRKEFLRSASALVAATALAALAGCGGGGTATATAEPDLSTQLSRAVDPSTLSDAEIAGMRYMREEEKLAHDVYVVMYGLWGLSVFDEISQSEARHTESVMKLLTKYGLDDPAEGHGLGEFEDPALQALYDALIAMGDDSAIAGLTVGALIEETDIRDINLKKAVTDNEDILKVYGNLLCGSTNHLRAFNDQLLAQGVTYVPQVISQEEWDAIVAANGVVCGGPSAGKLVGSPSAAR